MPPGNKQSDLSVSLALQSAPPRPAIPFLPARGAGSDRIDRKRVNRDEDAEPRPVKGRRLSFVSAANSRKAGETREKWHRYAKCSLRLSPRRFRGFSTRGGESDLAGSLRLLLSLRSEPRKIAPYVGCDVTANFLGSSRKRILGSPLTRAFDFDPSPPRVHLLRDAACQVWSISISICWNLLKNVNSVGF